VAATAAALAVLLLAACDHPPAKTAAAAPCVITVGIIGGPWADRVDKAVKPAMTAAGCSVKYIAGGAEEQLPKMIASRGGPPPVDVVELDEQTEPDLLKLGLLRRLDKDQLPNLTYLEPNMVDDYRVAYWAAEQALVYNIDKLKAAGIPTPRRYSDMLDPRLAGHVIIPDITYYSGGYALLQLAHENGGDERNPQPGFDALAHIHPHSYISSAATFAQLFQSGDAWISPFAAHLAVRLTKAGLHIGVVHPPIDGHTVSIAHGYLAVTAGSRQPRAATAFINAVIATGPQTTIYDDTAILPINNQALAAAEPTPAGQVPATRFEYFDPKVIDNGWAPNYAVLDRRDFARRWQIAVDAQGR
jgi:putative spermidine/putrescine transport system substrate-binding protein